MLMLTISLIFRPTRHIKTAIVKRPDQRRSLKNIVAFVVGSESWLLDFNFSSLFYSP